MNAYVTNLIRIGAAALVGFLVALAAKQGLPVLNAPEQDAIVGGIVTVVAPLILGFVSSMEKAWPWLTRVLPVKNKPAPVPAVPPAPVPAAPVPPAPAPPPSPAGGQPAV